MDPRVDRRPAPTGIAAHVTRRKIIPAESVIQRLRLMGYSQTTFNRQTIMFLCKSSRLYPVGLHGHRQT